MKVSLPKLQNKMEGIKKRVVSVRVAHSIHSLRSYHSSQLFQHMSPFIERGVVARRVGRTLLSFRDVRKIGVMQEKVLKHRVGRKWFVDTVKEIMKSKIDDSDFNRIAGKLDNLLKDNNLSGKRFARRVYSLIEKELEGKYSRRHIYQIIKASDYAVLKSIRVGTYGSGKVAIYDLGREKLYTDENSSPVDLKIGDRKSFKNVLDTLKKYGIDLSREDYYDIKNDKLVTKALIEGSSIEDSKNLYLKMHLEERIKDPHFDIAFREKMRKEVVKTYNAATVMSTLQEVLTKLPGYLVNMLSRMIARAVSVIPIVGSVASIQYEAAGALTELGDKLGDKIQTSSHMWYNMNDATSAMIKDAFMKQVNQQQAINLETSTPAVSTPTTGTSPH